MRDRAARGRSDRALAVELVVALGALAAAAGAVLVLPAGHPVRAVVVIGAFGTLPGYALATLTHPGRVASRLDDDRQETPARASLTGVERAALSVGLSIALYPVFGAVVGWLELGFATRTLLATTAVATAATLLAGGVRRYRTDPRDRYVLPLGSAVDRLRGRRRSGSASRVDVALTVGVGVAVVVAAAALVAGVVAPLDGSTYTEASLLTRGDGGDLVAADYDTNLSTDESIDLVLEVRNFEDRRVDYDVVVELQAIGDDGSLTRAERVARFERTVDDRGVWRRAHAVTPPFAGERLRLTYLLYRGDPPPDPSIDTAYRHLSLSLSVNASTPTTGGSG